MATPTYPVRAMVLAGGLEYRDGQDSQSTFPGAFRSFDAC